MDGLERREDRLVMWALIATLTMAGAACSSCERSEAGGEGTETSGEETQAGPVTPPGPRGTIEGVIRMVAGGEIPSYPDVRADTQPSIPESCTPPQIADRQPVALGDDGRGLVGVLVQASDFEQEVTREPVSHEVFIRDCRVGPRLIPAVRGDTLTLKNETAYPFLPSMGQSNLSTALLEGQSRDFPLDRGGIFSLQCGFAAPCGRADVIVVYHPVHAVTGDDGTFRMDNVPAGEEVRIHAWHPLFEEVARTVTVGEGETLRLEFELTPVGRPAPPAAPTGEEPTGPAEDQPGLF